MSGRSLFGSDQTVKPSGTNPANGRSVFESNYPRTGDHYMTIGIHDFGFAVFVDDLFQRLNAKAGIQRVGEPPRPHLAGRPVHDSHQIKKPAPHWDVGNVATPVYVVIRFRLWRNRSTSSPAQSGSAKRSSAWRTAPAIARTPHPAPSQHCYISSARSALSLRMTTVRPAFMSLSFEGRTKNTKFGSRHTHRNLDGSDPPGLATGPAVQASPGRRNVLG